MREADLSISITQLLPFCFIASSQQVNHSTQAEISQKTNPGQECSARSLLRLVHSRFSFTQKDTRHV